MQIFFISLANWTLLFLLINVSQPLSGPASFVSDLWTKSVHTSLAKPQTVLLSHWFCQSWIFVIVFLLACSKHKSNIYRQHKMQQLELSQNVEKLTTSRPFSDNCCPFMIAYTIHFFLPCTCQFMETFLSTSLISFISTPPLAFSDRLQDLSLMFLGQEILRLNDTVSEPSGMLLHPSGMHCLEA